VNPTVAARSSPASATSTGTRKIRAGQGVEPVRLIRDAIKTRVPTLLAELLPNQCPTPATKELA